MPSYWGTNYLGDVAAADTIVCLEFSTDWSKRWVDGVRAPAVAAEVGAGWACHKGRAILAETCRHVKIDTCWKGIEFGQR
jgi:hypothetical protein